MRRGGMVLSAVEPLRSFFVNAAGNRVLLMISPPDLGVVRGIGAQAASVCSANSAEILAILSPMASGWRAHFWNPDGTEESLCGNALRSAAKVLCAPGFECNVTTNHHEYAFGTTSDGKAHYFKTAKRGITVADLGGGQFDVDPGTPHRVVFCESLGARVIERMAGDVTEGEDRRNLTAAIWRPERRELSLRTIERGVGETESCASGALSAFVALTERQPDLSALDISFRSGARLRAHRSTKLSHGEETIAISGPATVAYSFDYDLASDQGEMNRVMHAFA